MNIGISDVASVVALLLSGFATWKTHRFNERQKTLIDSQEKLNLLLLDKGKHEALSEKKADLGASLNKMGSSNWQVKVWNKGKGIARNVRVDFPEGNELVCDSDVASKFPFEMMEQYQSVTLMTRVHMRTPRKTSIRLMWDDDDAHNHEKIVYLTL